MSLFSEFRDKYKVKTEDKNVRKYSTGDIHIREDKETGKLGLYLVETLSESKEEGWSIGKYEMRDTNIINPKDEINYTLEVSPSGHFYRRIYSDFYQQERYGKLYSITVVLQQILGLSIKQVYSMQYTKEQLIELIEKINEEKEGAIYQFVDMVQYGNDYDGMKVLEGLHIAIAPNYCTDEKKYLLKCVEDEGIIISTNKNNGTLIVNKDEKKEMVGRKNYRFVSTNIIPDVYPGRNAAFEGFTLEAILRIVQEHKKDKDEKRLKY